MVNLCYAVLVMLWRVLWCVLYVRAMGVCAMDVCVCVCVCVCVSVCEREIDIQTYIYIYIIFHR